MKISVEERITNDVDVKYICADLGVRYWEDSSVNGVDDISYDEQTKGERPRMPLAVEDPSARYDGEKYRWVIKINADTGNIEGWPEGVTANVFYKVCDDGIYWLETADGEEYHKIEDYVPKLFDFCNDSDGDYMIMTVDENGHIKEWYDEEELLDRIDSFLENEGF